MFRLVLILAIASFAHVDARRVSLLRHHTPTLDGRIVGGTNTTIEEHPYQLSLGYSGGHSCGASLIRPNVALTAAHCTEGKILELMTVRAGNTYRAKDGELAKVLRICDHPKFERLNSFDYDVSVLLLDRSLPVGPGIQPIDVQPANVEIATGAIATVTGFGRLSSGGASPIVLQKVQVPKVSQESCKASYANENISDRMHCFGLNKGGKDSCQGDSGGPLVVNGKVAGIVSWGYGCAWPELPGVYTKVSNLEIHDHIDTCIASFS